MKGVGGLPLTPPSQTRHNDLVALRDFYYGRDP